MLGCITAGAVIGFTLIGSAAVGTALGAAVGLGVVAVGRRGPAPRTH
jgi:hypothetical protein